MGLQHGLQGLLSARLHEVSAYGSLCTKGKDNYLYDIYVGKAGALVNRRDLFNLNANIRRSLFETNLLKLE